MVVGIFGIWLSSQALKKDCVIDCPSLRTARQARQGQARPGEPGIGLTLTSGALKLKDVRNRQ